MFKKIFLFLIIFSRLASAQEVDFDKEIQQIEHLTEYNQYDKAEEKANHLYKLLNEKYNDQKHLEQRLKTRLLQGIIKDSRFDQVDALPYFLEVLEAAKKNKLYRIACRANIRIAFNYEKANNYDLAYKYLNAAKALMNEHQMNDLKSAIFIRYALLHRFFGEKKEYQTINSDQKERMLKMGFKGSLDSSVYYTQKAIEYAQKHNNEYDLNEAYVTMGILYAKKRKNRVAESNEYFLKTIPYWEKTRNYEYAALMNCNVAVNYILSGDATTALKYNDAAYGHYNKTSVYYKYNLSKQRAAIFEALGNTDSAYHYLKIAYDDEIEKYEKEEVANTKRLEEQFQNDKKETVIKNKNQQMLLIGSLLAVIAVASILLFFQNRKISSRNKIINKQLAELSKTLEQKQVLLSELQHRVKNNLQHVISILEIQKESVDFNNIDELIRGNQNRIRSMALLHKKLNVSDNVNDVDLSRYITELSELVKESYDNKSKKINLRVACEIETISIEKALPIGLIIVELVSNSMKHAFRNQSTGKIEIILANKANTNQIYYADNGSGFDFYKVNEKGLGMEIVKGLADQLDAVVESNQNKGFELTLSFT